MRPQQLQEHGLVRASGNSLALSSSLCLFFLSYALVGPCPCPYSYLFLPIARILDVHSCNHVLACSVCFPGGLSRPATAASRAKPRSCSRALAAWSLSTARKVCFDTAPLVGDSCSLALCVVLLLDSMCAACFLVVRVSAGRLEAAQDRLQRDHWLRST